MTQFTVYVLDSTKKFKRIGGGGKRGLEQAKSKSCEDYEDCDIYFSDELL